MNRRRCRVSRFPQIPGAPEPLTVHAVRPVAFSDVDPMGIVWFGRHSLFVQYGPGREYNACLKSSRTIHRNK